MRHGPPELYQLYSAIHYTAIQRYTLYNLYNAPLVNTRDRENTRTYNKDKRTEARGATHLKPYRVVSTYDTERFCVSREGARPSRL